MKMDDRRAKHPDRPLVVSRNVGPSPSSPMTSLWLRMMSQRSFLCNTDVLPGFSSLSHLGLVIKCT